MAGYRVKDTLAVTALVEAAADQTLIKTTARYGRADLLSASMRSAARHEALVDLAEGVPAAGHRSDRLKLEAG